MHPRQRFLVHCFTLFGLCGLVQTAVAVDIPLRNWEVPQGDLSRTAIFNPAVPFVGIQPCRLVDTRPGSGFPAAWGAPALVPNATRDFDLDSAPHCPGVSEGARAYSVNVTVTEVTGPGDIRVWPRDNPPAVPTSVQNWTQSGPAFAIANAIIVPAGLDGGVTVQMAASSGHLLIDINGYFPANDLTTRIYFSTSSPTYAAGFENFGAGAGVFAQSSAGYGVLGVTALVGVPQAAGIRGQHQGGGIHGSGIWGSHSATGVGVYGTTSNGGWGGVYGAAGAGGVGVRGSGSGTGGYGVFVEGALGTTGTKQFVEPHPTDPAVAIRFVSLEGPEAGTYFRGRGKFLRGLATIAVPEMFRIVTAEEGLSVQVTPIGGMATVGVVRIGLNEIVVQGSRDLEFFYTVNGVRRAYKEWEAIGSSDLAFRPRTAEDKLPDYLSEDLRERLIANGTYNKDGSVNLETARKQGWDKDWNKSSASPKD